MQTEALYHFILKLKARHPYVLQSGNNNKEITGLSIQSLAYADALLRHSLLRPQLKPLPLQVAVIGPTQSGKSTVVNLLAGIEAAKANPLAGFTRHAQGFTTEHLTEAISSSIGKLFPNWKCLPPEQLSNQQLDSYSLVQIASETVFSNQPSIIWDTPDFDSVSSREYRTTVPQLCAIADLIVLVVSKEKYADQTVWQTLDLIAPINRPLIVCINKTSPDAADILVSSVKKRLETAQINYEAVVTLPYIETDELLLADASQNLRKQAHDALPNTPQISSSVALKNSLQRDWESWLTPIRQEVKAEKIWQSEVKQATNDTLEIYNRDYLQNPHYSETLQKAIIQLLALLEVPGIASTLSTARQIVTWPGRKIFSLWQEQRQSKSADNTPDNETAVINEAVLHTLRALQNNLMEQRSGTDQSAQWHRALSQQLQQEKSAIIQTADHAIKSHLTAFEPEIDAAAEKLYLYLQDHPVALNSLRATRITTDAAAVVLAVKSGGINVYDLAIAPAVLSFTSFLTESAVGNYMKSVEKELKQKQLTSVEHHIIDQLLNPKFIELTTNMPNDGLYQFSAEELEKAEQAMEQLAQ
ncbi:MAG: 50S ribosome-binding GTPase [Gammaproteobacteria bacterium]|nr:50S ribosome-binding GTPase [Gammaproteobacteria bacterium]